MMELHNVFAGLEGEFIAREKSRIAILPVPYDKTSTWIKGADKGPFAVIEASPALEYYDIETGTEVYKNGIHTCSPLVSSSPPEIMVREVENNVNELLSEGKFVVTLGGEHSVSVGAIKAHSSYKKEFSVLQLDAHTDLREEYRGSRFNHACTMARVKEICPAVHVGIRSMDIEEIGKADPQDVFYAKDIVGNKLNNKGCDSRLTPHDSRGKDWVGEVMDRLGDNVYVTIDFDVFDPSIMPSTGTPEPGGLLWYDVMDVLRTVAEKKNVIGFDCVELCPIEGNRSPDFLAAKLIYTFLSYIFKYKVE